MPETRTTAALAAATTPLLQRSRSTSDSMASPIQTTPTSVSHHQSMKKHGHHESLIHSSSSIPQSFAGKSNWATPTMKKDTLTLKVEVEQEDEPYIDIEKLDDEDDNGQVVTAETIRKEPDAIVDVVENQRPSQAGTTEPRTQALSNNNNVANNNGTATDISNKSIAAAKKTAGLEAEAVEELSSQEQQQHSPEKATNKTLDSSSATTNPASSSGTGTATPSALAKPQVKKVPGPTKRYSNVDPVTHAEKFNDHLIEDVRPRTDLYDFNCDGYKLSEIRMQHWAEIEINSGKQDAFLKKRWKTLRDRFKKEYDRNQRNKSRLTLWPHYSNLLFLVPYIRDRYPIDDTPTPPGGFLAAALMKRRGGGDSAKQQQPKVDLDTGEEEDHEEEAKNSSRKRSRSKAGSHATSSSSSHNSPSPQPRADLTKAKVSQNGGGNEFLPHAATQQTLSTGQNSGAQQQLSKTIGGPAAVEALLELASRDGAAPSKRLHLEFETNNKYNEIELKTGGTRPSAGADLPIAGSSGSNDNNDDEEDELFCRIVKLKIRRLDGERKERVKARILELLVEMQYGATL